MMVDIILGGLFVVVSMLILICSIFLRERLLSMCFSLFNIIFCTGILMMTYSQLVHVVFKDQKEMINFSFDVALLVLMPSLTYLFEMIFGSGYASLITYFRRFQVGYAILCFIFIVSKQLSSASSIQYYYKLSMLILGYTMLIQIVLLVATLMYYVAKRDKSAVILCVGFSCIIGTVLMEWITYYETGTYHFFASKWGIVAFIIALIIMCGNSFVHKHDQVVQYSRELEMFSDELQRCKKTDTLSYVAASVADEVRNPLQVSKGFLQLLFHKYRQKREQQYLELAIHELDLASSVITDYLTFGKPTLDCITDLNIRDEITHVLSILQPIAHLSRGDIMMNIPTQLKIRGNASKFKQAIFNVIKNSIEAWSEDGTVRIWAYQEHAVIYIHIQDNGKGMQQEEITKLGEPYFSGNRKGSGLGLMVSFKIVEVMCGKIYYKSQKGVGTEAILTFPSAKPLSMK
ncbi:ATP-binding protein [Paenibacillus sp. CMAA1364]